MRHATITTRFAGATNTRGSRIIAKEDGCPKTLTMPYRHDLDPFENHEHAARKLFHNLGGDLTQTRLVAGPFKLGYVFVTLNTKD